MNPYQKDALFFFKAVSTGIKSNNSDSEIVHLTLSFSLGMERLLKSILYNVNPLYVLIEPDFKNSLPVIYADKFLTEAKSSKEIASKPNEDVITFRNSLLRSQLVSKTAFENKGLLFNLSDCRDIIAHHQLSKLDLVELKIMLLRDYYPLLKSFAIELGINKPTIFHGKSIELAKLSSKLQDDIEKQIELKFESIRERFKMLENNPGYIANKDLETAMSFSSGNKYKVDCPCCGYTSLLYTEPIYEFNPYEKAEIKIGVSVKKLKCFYCKFETNNYKELDFLKISPPIAIDNEDDLKCSRCGDYYANDGRGSSLCSKCEEYYGTEN